MITPSLDEAGVFVQDPCKTEPLATGMDVVTAQEQFNRWIKGGRYDLFAAKFRLVIDKDMRIVGRSDFIIVHLFSDIGTTGTIHEMARAWRLHKPIYLIYYGAISSISKWALFLTTDSGGTETTGIRQSFRGLLSDYLIELNAVNYSNINRGQETDWYLESYELKVSDDGKRLEGTLFDTGSQDHWGVEFVRVDNDPTHGAK